MKKQLTDKQQQVLDFVEGYVKEHGYSPSINDIAEHFKYHKAAAIGHLNALEKKGYIVRSEGVARSIVVV